MTNPVCSSRHWEYRETQKTPKYAFPTRAEMPKNDPGCGQMARAAKKITRSFQPRKKFRFKQTQLAMSQLILQAGSRASLGRDLPWRQWEGRAGDISECELGAPTAPPAAARGPGGAAANILFLMVSSAQEIQGLPHPRQLGGHGVPVPHQSSCKSTLEVLIFRNSLEFHF